MKTVAFACAILRSNVEKLGLVPTGFKPFRNPDTGAETDILEAVFRTEREARECARVWDERGVAASVSAIVAYDEVE